MSNIVPLQFESHAVRAAVDEDGKPWLVAKDVADVLGYDQTSSALKLCKLASCLDEFNKSNGLAPATKWIPESDVYRLVLRSTLPSAERFQSWVVEEVLPAIRKTGSYAVPKTPGQALVEMAQNFLHHETQIAELARKQHETAAQVRALMDGDNYLTVVGWGNLTGLRFDSATASRIGKLASALCRERGHHIGTTLHPAYGRVNTYPREVLDELGAPTQD